MSTYLIDFENVKSAGLNGIDRIAASDSVHLFWSARENKISIEMMELIRKSASEIEMHKASIGERDALDHQLCSYLGYLAGQAKDDSFVIISNDKAYDHLIEFWKELRSDIKIVRVPEIAKVSLPAAKALANASKNAENVVKAETAENSRESEASKPVAAESEQPANENNRRKRERSKTENGGRRGRNRFDKRRNSEELTEANQEPAAEDATILERKDKQDFAVKTNPEQEALKQEENEQKTQNSDQIAVDDKAETKADDVKAEKLSSAEKLEKPVRETEKETEKEAVNETVKEESSKEASVKEMGEDSPSQTEKEKANIAESSFWGTPKDTEEETIKKPVSVVSVVSRIVTGIVRESGYTANGIMDGYKVQEEENREAVSEAAEAYEKAEEVFAGKEEITAEPLTENASEQATEAAGETVTVSEAAVTEGADEKAKEADEAVSVTAAVTEGADETVKEDGEAAEAADAVTEAADEAVKAAEEADEAAEVTESEAAVTEAADEAVKTAEEADVAAEAKEAETDEIAGEAFVAKDEVSVLESKTEDHEEEKEAKAETKKPARSRSRKPAKKAEEKEASEEEKPAKPDKKSRTSKTAKKAKTESGEAVKSEKQEGQKKETAKKKTTKTAVKAQAEILVSEGKEAEEVKPVRASKVKKAADSEKLTESAKKSPVTEADVLSKFPEAEGKEWLSQIVAAINESADRRIMYGMIVKVLGQEYGRSVYHAIKSLK